MLSHRGGGASSCATAMVVMPGVESIPDDWSEQDVMDLLLSPMKDPSAPYPSWEVPARAFGSPKLFRWWEPR
jgi:hypothetical protein